MGVAGRAAHPATAGGVDDVMALLAEFYPETEDVAQRDADLDPPTRDRKQSPEKRQKSIKQ